MSFEEYCLLNDIYLYNISLPTKIKGLAYYTGECYVVYINSRISFEQQQKTTVHELIHILENHFSCPADCYGDCEQRTSSIIRELRSLESIYQGEYAL